LESLFITAAKQFGPAATVAVVLIILVVKVTNLINKIENRVEGLEQKMNSVGSTCENRKDSFRKVYDRLDGLESKDLKIDGVLNVIDTKLTAQAKEIGSIGKNVETILQHFAQKGMDA